MLFISDGSTGFYADPRAAWQGIKALEECPFDQFWERAWLQGPVYDSLAEVWESLDSPQFEAEDKPPRASDYVSVGRLRPLGPKQFLLQTESGEYAVVDEKQTAKWRLTPLD